MYGLQLAGQCEYGYFLLKWLTSKLTIKSQYGFFLVVGRRASHIVGMAVISDCMVRCSESNCVLCCSK